MATHPALRRAIYAIVVQDGYIRSVLALYTEACTVVRSGAEPNESFEVKVVLFLDPTGSTDVCCCHDIFHSSEARSGPPSELLYADDLVLMAPRIEQLGRRVAEWRVNLLDKGPKVSAGKSKVMVGSSRGKIIVSSGKWPCGKGMQATSIAQYVKSGFTSGVVVCVVTCHW